jgi:RNA polymerase sigma-70 factor (ECF subfamily)
MDKQPAAPVNELSDGNAGPGVAPPCQVDTDRLYRDYATAVARWAGRLVRSPADVEDIVQEVFLVVERRRFSLPALQNPASWLYRVTTNIVRRRWRDQGRHGVSRPQWLDDLADDTPSPLDEVERRRLMESLDRAMDSLRDQDRKLLWLSDVRCLPTSRISEMTGIKPQTLRVRRFRARLQIARRLREAPPRSASPSESARLVAGGSVF